MKVFYSSKDWKQYKEQHSVGTLGFVPTMGALHQGHLSLITAAKQQNDAVMSSIFVNPTQFNNATDLEKYPRTVSKDIELLQKVGCDFVIVPEVNDLYPNGLQTESIFLNGLDKEMEGAFRPGHFDGVATVVKRLFGIVEPNKAYFGEKDFQQLQIIKQMVRSESLHVEIHGMPIIREANGLAMSSRNERLTQEQRSEAKLIYEMLQFVKESFHSKTIAENIIFVENSFKNSIFELEYFVIVNEDTLQPMNEKISGISYRAFIACFADEVRLIDNLYIGTI